MTPILQAAAQGYSSEQILKYLQNAFPKLTPKILQATASGYSIDHILKYVNKLMEEETFSPHTTPHEIEAAHQKKYNEYGKKILGTAATAAGLTSFAKNLPKLVQTLGSIGQSVTSKPQEASEALPSDISTTPVQQENKPLQTPKITPSQIPPEQSYKIIEQMGIGPQIQTLHKAGNNVEAISAAVGTSMRPNQRKWLDEQIKNGSSKSLPDLITDFLGQNSPVNEKISPEIAENVQNQPVFEQKSEEKLQKGSLVATPSGGVGSIKSERNGKALVDIDGKLHQTNIDDLIQSPLPEKDLAELYEDLLKGIEKKTGEDVSRNANWVGYDPQENSLAYLPHDGSLYIYDDIPEEEVKELTSVLSKRKTTGQNFIGLWKEGTKSPIGAAMHRLIVKLQSERGGKGKEYSRKYPTVYSAIEPAEKALKEAKKKKKRIS